MFRFLGAFDIRHGEQQLPKPATLKSLSLLAYLVMNRRQPQSRERLAEMFWRDWPQGKARHNLSTALWRIRHCLPDKGALLGDTQTVQFDTGVELWVDVEEFELRVTQDDQDCLVKTLEFYRGEFLTGLYDDWVINKRYRLEAVFLEALARLMTLHGKRGEDRAALLTALRLLEMNPMQEEAHRITMLAYCRLGQRANALNQYKHCRQFLLNELGVEPTPETQELFQSILEGQVTVAREV
jgi:DNA-binding SARP family transcriptional activator